MRNKVIEFLKNPSSTDEENYNNALQLYMRSQGANKGIANYHNAQGYSAQRLEELLYDLKQLHGVSPADLATVSKKKVSEKGTSSVKKEEAKKPEDSEATLPKFAKGTKGNHERRDFVEAHGLTAKSNSNDDLDAAISEFMASEAALRDLEVVESKETTATENNSDKASPEAEKK